MKLYTSLSPLLLLAFGASACFVDLDRDESFLAVTLEALDAVEPAPAAVWLRLSGEEGLEPYEIELSLVAYEGGRARLPVLGATAGTLTLEVRLLDSVGVGLEQLRSTPVVLRSGETTAVLLAFGEVPSRPAASDPGAPTERPPVSGITIVERLTLPDAPVAGPPGGGIGGTEVGIDSGSLNGLLERLEMDLGDVPVRLDLRGLVIATVPLDAGSSPPELDDAFAGEVTVTLRSGSLGEVELARFTPSDEATAQLDLIPTINLDSWLEAIPGDVTLDLRGLVSGDDDGDDDDDDPVIRLRLTLLFAGAR